MCRILIARFQKATQPSALLERFADMARASRSLDGDWQGDGWGVAWLDQQGNWQMHHSLAPIWQEQSHFGKIPPTPALSVHARSASFAEHKDVIDYNQPFSNGSYTFVFNGMIKGVKLPMRVPGRIGAQKLWNLLCVYLRDLPPDDALRQLHETIITHSQQIRAMNIGLLDQQGVLYSLCCYHDLPAYYHLQTHSSAALTFVCSEPLQDYPCQPVIAKTVETR